MATFNERFKELRKNKGLSQRELAIALHMSNSTIAMYETGKRQPDFEALEQIADFFNVDMDYLLGRKDTTHKIIEVHPHGHSPEYYEDTTVQKVTEAMRTNPESRIVFDAVSDMKPEDLIVIAKLIEKKSD